MPTKTEPTPERLDAIVRELREAAERVMDEFIELRAELERVTAERDGLLSLQEENAAVLDAAEDFALIWSNPDLVADYDRVAEKVVRAVRVRSGNPSGKAGTK